MTNQFVGLNRTGADPFPNPAKVTYNAIGCRPFFDLQRRIPESQCFLGGNVNDYIQSIQGGQVLLMPSAKTARSDKTFFKDYGTMLGVIGSLNRLPLPPSAQNGRAQSSVALLAEVISQFDFGGVSANYTEEDTTGMNPKNDLAVLFGGGGSIKNTGTKVIRPGQKVYWDIPPDTETALNAIMANPSMNNEFKKITPWTMPFDDEIQELTAATWRDTLGTAILAHQAGDLTSFNDGTFDPLTNPVATRGGKTSSVMSDSSINLMLNLVDLMLVMRPLVDALVAAADEFRRQSSSSSSASKPHLAVLRDTLHHIRNHKNHVRDTVKMRNNVHAMLKGDHEAAQYFANTLVPDHHPDFLMYNVPIGTVMSDLDINDNLRVFANMQNRALDNTLRLSRRVLDFYTRRIFCTALSQAAPGEYFDATINGGLA